MEGLKEPLYPVSREEKFIPFVNISRKKKLKTKKSK